jgi:hypothetical protein
MFHCPLELEITNHSDQPMLLVCRPPRSFLGRIPVRALPQKCQILMTQMLSL